MWICRRMEPPELVTRTSTKLASFKIHFPSLCHWQQMPDTSALVNAAWLKWTQVIAVLCEHKIPVHLKSEIYECVVWPVALYSSECWNVTVRHEQALVVMEMRILRWALDLTRLDHVRNNDLGKINGLSSKTEKMHKSRFGIFYSCN